MSQIGRGGRTRTLDPRFWRPMLYQLSYTPAVIVYCVSLHQNRFRLLNDTLNKVTQPWFVEDAPLLGQKRESVKATFSPFSIQMNLFYLMIFATTPAPTVRPPSRIAKRRPSSMAIGAISSTVIFTSSPGITISVPSGS
jgi:hypothetical protein